MSLARSCSLLRFGRAAARKSGPRRSPAAVVVLVSVWLVAAPGGSAAAAPASGTISTIAGGVGGPAAATAVAMHPTAVAAGGGSLYVTDATGETVRAISAASGKLTTLTGAGVPGGAADDVPAAAAPLSPLMGIAVDQSGNVLIGDAGDRASCGGCGDVIRVVATRTGIFYGRSMTAGHLYIVAGQLSQQGWSGDGGPARSAQLFDPGGVAVDASGDVAIIDAGNDRIRLVAGTTGSHFDVPMIAGDIYTLAGSGVHSYFGDGDHAWNSLVDLSRDSAVAFDASGNLIFADSSNDVIRVIAALSGTFYGVPMTKGFIYHVAGNGIAGHSGDGGAATSAELQIPVGVALDAKGSIVIGDAGNNLVRVVANRTGTSYGRTMIANHIYTIAGVFSSQGSFSGEGGLATAAHFSYPSGVAVDASGNVAIADGLNDRVRLVAAGTSHAYGRSMTAGHVYTVAGNGSETYSGDGGPALAAQMHQVTGAFVDGGGNLIVADGWNERLRIIPTKTGTYYGRALRSGISYTLAGTGTDGFFGDTGPAATAQIGLVNHFNGVGDFVDYATGIALDKNGHLIFADTDNHRIRLIAARSGHFYGISMQLGHIYTLAGNGTFGYSGDGGLATHAAIRAPDGVAIDGAGNIVLTDVDALSNAVRVVAATTGRFYGQSMTAGHIYTMIGQHCSGTAAGDGGLARNACLDWPTSVAVDAKGNVLITEPRNGDVRLVAARTGTFYGHAMQALHITTVARPPGAYSLTLDGNGNVLVASGQVRVIAARTGHFYGQAMVLGHLYAIAGNGSPGVAGDGGPALLAQLSPVAVAVNALGDVLIADGFSNRIRLVRH